METNIVINWSQPVLNEKSSKSKHIYCDYFKEYLLETGVTTA